LNGAKLQTSHSEDIHSSKTIEILQTDGNQKTYTPSMTPSQGDYDGHRDLTNEGYHATAIQVGQSNGVEVNFYNAQNVVATMKYSNFKNLIK